MEHLQEIGHNFCDAILDYCDPDQAKVKTILEELEILYPRISDGESDEGSGDSDYSGDEEKKKRRKKKPRKAENGTGKKKKRVKDV